MSLLREREMNRYARLLELQRRAGVTRTGATNGQTDIYQADEVGDVFIADGQVTDLWGARLVLAHLLQKMAGIPIVGRIWRFVEEKSGVHTIGGEG